MVAHVGDFGLARLLHKAVNNPLSDSDQTTPVIKRTNGYTARGNIYNSTSPSRTFFGFLPVSSKFNQTALIFFFSVFWGFLPLYNAFFTFPQERQMLLKERASGMYRLSSYFMARTADDLPMELALPTAFTFIIYWIGGVDPHTATFLLSLLSLLILLYSVLVAQSLGLAFGAILMEVKQATTLASVTTLTFLIAGGYYVQHIPPFILWLKYLSYSFYCFKLLVGVQFRPHDTYECSNGRCSVLDFPAIKLVGLDLLWVDVLIMGLMLVGY